VSVDRIAILVHPTRDVRRAISGLTTWAEEHDAAVVQLGGPGHAPKGTIDGASLVVAIGGDGTVLAALRAAAPGSLPVLGVACGSLGALTTVAAPDLPGALERFAADDWTAHHIPALAIEPETGETATAMNDLVVVRAGGSQVTSSVAVDGVLYGRFAGDGVIVSTQLGSSAYSMAAGGPVLAPGNGTWLITPLNPHGGCLPPVVVPASADVRLEVEPGFAGARVEIDGRPADLELGAYDITLRDDFATLVRLGDEEEYFTGLRRRRILIDSPRVMARDARAALPPPTT
jgi:NAD+ kinase